MYLLPTAFLTDSIIGKSGSLYAKSVSAMPQHYENYRMINWFPEIMHKNVYHVMFISKGSKLKSGSKPIAKYSELQTMCTKHSNPLGINFFTHPTRKLHIDLKGYYLTIGTVPRRQDLLKTTIPCSGDDLVGLQLKNHEISILALPVLVIHKEKCSWRIRIINQAAKIISKLRFLTSWWAYLTDHTYSGIHLKSSAQWISNDKAGKYETEFHAIARIYRLLDFPMEPHLNWTKCRFMEKNKVYLGFIMHANHIIKKEEIITAIHDLKIPRNTHEEGSYTGQAWVYFLIDCTGKIKTKWTGELRISFPKIANILFCKIS